MLASVRPSRTPLILFVSISLHFENLYFESLLLRINILDGGKHIPGKSNAGPLAGLGFGWLMFHQSQQYLFLCAFTLPMMMSVRVCVPRERERESAECSQQEVSEPNESERNGMVRNFKQPKEHSVPRSEGK
jgi:hypothetical protein